MGVGGGGCGGVGGDAFVKSYDNLIRSAVETRRLNKVKKAFSDLESGPHCFLPLKLETCIRRKQ